MNAWHLKTLAALALLAGLVTPHVAAAPRAVEPFDKDSWATLQSGLRQPAVVVFSTTDCAHCPAVVDGLARDIRERKLKAQLLTVVMDAAPGEDDAALLAHPHYARANRLFAFAGQAPALRHSVEPKWRGVTPYVVFLAPGVAAQAVTGPPSPADVAAWALSARKGPGGATR